MQGCSRPRDTTGGLTCLLRVQRLAVLLAALPVTRVTGGKPRRSGDTCVGVSSQASRPAVQPRVETLDDGCGVLRPGRFVCQCRDTAHRRTRDDNMTSTAAARRSRFFIPSWYQRYSDDLAQHDARRDVRGRADETTPGQRRRRLCSTSPAHSSRRTATLHPKRMPATTCVITCISSKRPRLSRPATMVACALEPSQQMPRRRPPLACGDAHPANSCGIVTSDLGERCNPGAIAAFTRPRGRVTR